MVGVRDPGQDPLADEVVQALGEDVAGDPEPGLEVVEPPHAHHRVPDDEQAPPLPHDIKALGDRTAHIFETGPLHKHMIEGCVIKLTPRDSIRRGLRNAVITKTFFMM